jgi:hypothetical protein
LAGRFFLVAPGESKFIPVRGNPRWSTKKSPRLLAGRFFLVAPGESKFIPDRGNPRWSTKIEKTSNPLRLLVFLYLSMLCGAFGKLFGAKNVADLRLFSA